jgi:hypothetical protein
MRSFALALVALVPSPALAQERPWEWGWGRHPTWWMWGAGGMVMPLPHGVAGARR